MKELYEKVFIKTEADYPKENGLYFCVDQNRHYIGERSFDKDDKINLHIWSGVNWYLQPVTAKTEQEANRQPYECTDCKEVTFLKNNGEIRVGFCAKCGHPIWNPIEQEKSFKTYSESLKHDEIGNEIPIEQETNEQPKRVSAEEFVKNKLNEKTGQGITLYEHYLAYDTTISIGTAVSWMTEFASQHPIEQEKPDNLPQSKLQEEFGKDFINSEGYFSSDYVDWLEAKILEQKKPSEDESPFLNDDEQREIRNYYSGQKPSESAEEILYAKSLKEMVGLALSYDECLSFVRGIYASQKHLPTDCYPKKFVIYCIYNVASYGESMYSILDEKMVFTTLDELFIYWRDKTK